MKYMKNKITFSVLIQLIFISSVFAQINLTGERELEDEGVEIKLASFNDPGSEKSRLYFFFKVSYEMIQFVKDNDGFKGEFDLAVEVINKNKDYVFSDVLNKTLKVEKYNSTDAENRFSIIEKSFILDPGKYKIRLELEDSQTKSTKIFEHNVKLDKYDEDRIDTGDILFYHNRGLVSDEKTLDNSENTIASYIAFTEVYNVNEADKYTMKYDIYNEKKKKVISRESVLQGKEGVDSIYIDLRREDLSAGLYNIQIEFKNGKKKTKTSSSFAVYWAGMPITEKELDEAISQMRYIDRENKSKKIRKKNFQEKMTFFKEFWEKMDPTPGTPENEHMKKYYSRVRYSTFNFKGRRQGWNTDMGMVYILMGPPDEIYRSPSSADARPWNSWQYYRHNITLVFEDFSGLGFYKLKNLNDFYHKSRFDF